VNTYTGPTYVNAGTVTAGSTQAFGVNSALIIANQPGVAINLAGNSNSVGSLSGGGSNGGGIALGGATLTTGGDSTSTVYGGAITGTGNLVKTGPGTQTLSGSSNFVGTVTVQAGKVIVGGTLNGLTGVQVNNGAGLAVNGLITAASPVSVSGTLSGNGTVGDVTIASDGTVAPGNGNIGTLSATSWTLQGTVVMELNKSGLVLSSDELTAINGIDVSGPLTVSLLGGTGALLTAGDTFHLFQGGFYNGSFSSLLLPDLSAYGLSWKTDSLMLDGTLAVVPEPATWAMIVGGMGMLAFGQRLRRRKI